MMWFRGAGAGVWEIIVQRYGDLQVRLVGASGGDSLPEDSGMSSGMELDFAGDSLNVSFRAPQ